MAVADLRVQLDNDTLRRIIKGAVGTKVDAAIAAGAVATTPNPPAAAGVLYVDRQGRVLLVEPKHKPYWDLPGGQVEPGESPRAAAVREVREELGVTLPIGELLAVDYLPTTGSRPESMRYVFGCRWDPPGDGVPFRLQSDELSGWAWCDCQARVERLRHAPILAARIEAALAACENGRTVYLEGGREVTRR